MFLLGLIAITEPSFVQDTGGPIAIGSPKNEYSPYLDHNYPDEMFFGDTHTPYSTSSSA